MTALMITASVLVALYLGGCVIRLLYRAESGHDELHYAETSDGVRLALYRYLPAEKREGAAPVILCHGVTSNRFTWDQPGRNLARWLADRGHDVWSLELRGGGRSKHRAGGGKISYRYNFDDHVTKDAPAAIGRVLEITGTASADWVGHSLGGMVLYAQLALGAAKIRRGCALGSPGTFEGTPRPFHTLGAIAPPPAVLPVIHSTFFLTFALVFVRLGLTWTALFTNVKNTGLRRLTCMAVNMTENFSTQLGLHLSYMVRKGDLRQFPPGDFSYQSNMRRITAPLLLVAGKRDLLAPAFRLEYVFDNISSAEKKLIVLSRENGYSADYGHCDLIFGLRAEQEVWPEIAAWLK
jgi:pimeloyl-ACP methyl ester carboxylesterase